MARKYSYMYSRLVKSDQDVVGSIAYSLYKSAKISYIRKIEAETGSPISESKLQDYDRAQQTQEQIELYLDKANRLLAEFNQDMLEAVVSHIEKEAADKHSFWYGAWQSVVGAFVYSLLLALVALVLHFVKPGVLGAVIGLLG